MQPQADPADLRQAEHAAVHYRATMPTMPTMPTMRADLRRGKAIVAVRALQALVARLCACRDASKAGGQRRVQAVQHVLQDLRVEVAVLGPYLLAGRQLCRLHGKGHRDAALFPGGCALLQASV